MGIWLIWYFLLYFTIHKSSLYPTSFLTCKDVAPHYEEGLFKESYFVLTCTDDAANCEKALLSESYSILSSEDAAAIVRNIYVYVYHEVANSPNPNTYNRQGEWGGSK